MHILYLSSLGGGLDTNVRVLAPALIKAGHRVSVLYIHFPNETFPNSSTATDGYRVYHIRMGSWHYYVDRATFGIGGFSLVVRSLEYARSLACAVADIHSREPINLIETPEVFVTQGWVRDIPYLMRLHSSAWMCRRMYNEPAPFSDSIDARLEGYALCRAVGISSPSQFVANYIRSSCHVDKPIEIIRYPIDTEQFAPGAERANPPIVLFVGRVEKRKGADVLMRAIPLIRAKHPDCEFVFAGRVSDELKDSLPCENGGGAGWGSARFLGVRPRKELVEWYQRAAIFAAPSLWDNSPNTIYEAMTCGTPVVATRVGGIPELVDDGATGLLVPPSDANALANAIIALLDDPVQRERMGRCAREKAIAEYGVERIAVRTLEFYQNALSVPSTFA